MAWKLTIAGTDRTTSIWRGEPVTFERLLNDRATADFVCRPDLFPDRLSEVVIYATDGTTPLFGGVVIPGGRSWEGVASSSADVRTAIECGDFFTYLDWTYLTLTYTTGPTLKTVLQAIVAALPGSTGITLDATQANGPTLEPFSWTYKKASEAVRELCDRTGYVVHVSPTKVLSAAVPGLTPAGGAQAAPFAITDAAWHCDELTARDNDRVPANKVILLCGPSGAAPYTQAWTATGSESAWVAEVPAAGPGGYGVCVVTVGGVVSYATVDEAGSGAGWFSWDWTTRTLEIENYPLTLPIPAGSTLSFQYIAQYPFPVIATTSATPVIEMLATAEAVTVPSQGQELADGILAQVNQPAAREITFWSREHGWSPGQALTVDLEARGVTGAFVITAVTADLMTDAVWRYTVTALESTIYQGNYLDEWRALTGGSSSVAVALGSIVTTPVAGTTDPYDVTQFGATGDGTTDDTAAIQSAIDAAVANPAGATVYFPPGTYCVTTLDLHVESVADPTQSLHLRGAGRWSSVLKGTSNGAILLDAIGRCYLSIEHLRVTTDGTAVYQCALLLARRTGGSLYCRDGAFAYARFDGEYSIATVVAIASECNTWHDVEMVNDCATNGYCCFFSGTDNSLAGVSSTHGTPLSGPNTYNLMLQVTWGAFYNNATPVIFHQAATYTMVGCSVQVGYDKTGVKCVSYIDSTGGGFYGPVNWISTLWEVGQCTVHYLDTRAPATLGVFLNIIDREGAFTHSVAAASYAFKQSTIPAALFKCRVEGARFVSASGTLNIDVGYVFNCHLDIWTQFNDSTITVNTQRSSSFLRAKTLTIPAATSSTPTYGAAVVDEFADTDARLAGKLTTFNVGAAGLDGAEGAALEFSHDSYRTWKHVVHASLSATAGNSLIKFALATGAGTDLDVLTMTAEGHVGIGTTDPEAELHVVGTAIGGTLYRKQPVAAVTTTAGPDALASGQLYTNEGDADGATVTLPTAAAELMFMAYVQTGQTLTIAANTGDTIRIGGSVTAAAGSVTSNVVGSALTLVAINATEWIATAVVGSWSV